MSNLPAVEVDSEFRHSNEQFQEVVCFVCRVADEEFRYWVMEEEEKARFRADWNRWMSEDRPIISYNAVAEARSLLSMGYAFDEIIRWTWIDPYIWWKMLVGSHPAYRWGPKFVTKGGKRILVVSTPPPFGEIEEDTWEEDEEGNLKKKEAKETHKAQKAGLATAVGAIFGVDLNEEHKETMVQMILTTEVFTAEQREQILDYCANDVKYLKPLARELVRIVRESTDDCIGVEHLKNLSRYSVCTAQMESNGIPLALERTKKLAGNIPFAEDALIHECVKHYPFYAQAKMTAADKRAGKVGTLKWVEKRKNFVDYVKAMGAEEVWPRNKPTAKNPQGSFKGDEKTLKDFTADKTIALYRTTKKSRSAFRYLGPDKWKKMQGNVGKDSHIRPSLMPWGTVTSRHTPKPSRGYIFAMSTWLRTLIGLDSTLIVAGDYASEEMIIQAWASGDDKLMAACASGDPYLWLAQYCGAVDPAIRKTPEGYVDGEGVSLGKERQQEVKGIRDTYKSLMLGIGYGMGNPALALRLTQNRILSMLTEQERETLSKSRMDPSPELQAIAYEIMKKVLIVADGNVPEDRKAKTYSAHHRKTFSEYWKWRESYVAAWKDRGWASTPDGWCIFSHAPEQTVKNFYIQGTGQTILRRAILRCLLNGLRVCSPLHDAIYCESLPENAEADKTTMVEEMVEAAKEVLGEAFLKVDPKILKTNWNDMTSGWTGDKAEQAEVFKKLGKYMC